MEKIGPEAFGYRAPSYGSAANRPADSPPAAMNYDFYLTSFRIARSNSGAVPW